MRLLIDECMARAVVERLRDQGHDVLWSAEDGMGDVDPDVLARSVAEDRILITRDHDFGNLVFGKGSDAIGVVMVSISSAAPVNETANRVAACVARFGESGLRGKFTTVHADRTRQRALPAPRDLA